MRKLIFISISVLIVSITGYVYWYYYNPYGEGYKQGILKKLERHGDLFKTYEGELQEAGNDLVYNFSIDEETIADTLQHCLDKTVRLHYIQYRRSLPWRGDNYEMKSKSRAQDVVDRVEVLSE
ncbi:MAG: hypothetical protein BGO69_17915 [Bacteroidetes bacterium 46-16]|nr:MAG: hypothetical protein BGO69_17915 [Bacteroidetes bacterium 46-16]